MKIENKTPIAEEIIRNNPTGHGLFAGIGDNFNSVAQVICELMDDAVSNLRANKDDSELSMRVVLSLENLGDAVEITVTDGGTGIADLNEQAEAMFSRLVKQLSEKEGVTEALKAENQMLWVQKMNNIRNATMEIVSDDLIYA